MNPTLNLLRDSVLIETISIGTANALLLFPSYVASEEQSTVNVKMTVL